MVCSKNVAILVRSKSDVEMYAKLPNADRYTFAIEMANVWLEKVESLSIELAS